jgi:CubicO group peptidase (beta-lactamase class C family)
MQNALLGKFLVVGTIILLVGTVVSPLIGEKSPAKAVMVVGQNLSVEDRAFNDSIVRIMNLGHIYSLSACVIKENQIAWAGGYGHCNMDQNKQPTSDTIYLIASISKTITATALLQLYEQGLFTLDDAVNNKLNFPLINPNYPNNPITYRMLLNHTSSLATEPAAFYRVDYQSDPPSLSSWLSDYFYPNGTFNIDAWSNYPPGTRFDYSNLGFCLIAYLVELWSNESFNEYCKKNIFNPLDMQSTSFLLSELTQNDLAVPYIQAYIGKKNEDNLYLPLPPYSILFYPAGGLRTSVMDLSHFLIAHMNGGVYNDVRILNESTVLEMHNISSYGGRNLWYGLGWGISCDSKGNAQYMGHGGDLYGFITQMKFHISDNIGVIYFLTRDLSTGYLKEGVSNLAYTLIESLLFAKGRHLSS